MLDTRRPIRFGIQTWNQETTIPELRSTWRVIDKLGFDTVWVPDHFIPVLTDPAADCFEAWTLLAALALETHHARIGVLVSGNTYRHPAILAKMGATIDHISGGRLILGLGAAWFEREHFAYGIPFYTPAERIRRLDEALHIIRRLWLEPRTNFQGRFYQLRDAFCAPKPVQQPMPPILVGAAGEKLALRVVARHADIWNTMGSPSIFKRKITVLREHCVAVGRTFEDIEISWAGFGVVTRSNTDERAWIGRLSAITGLPAQQIKDSSLVGSPDEIAERICSFVRLGVTHFILNMFSPFEHDNLARFSGEVIARFR